MIDRSKTSYFDCRQSLRIHSRQTRFIANVRFGSLADTKERISDVRFTPESRHSVRRRKESVMCHKRTRHLPKF
jgi:hypothetical protein